MEVSGLERALQEVKSLSIDTNRLATDRHLSVVKLRREKYSNIEHVFDVWHVSKSLQKKLHHVSTTKVNSSLQLWSKSIVNHVWGLQNRAREMMIFWKKSTSHCSNMSLMSIGGKMDIK